MRAPRMPQEWAAEPSYIYAIQSGEFIKVGISRDIERRLRQMIELNPHGPKVVMRRRVNRNTAPAVEKRMHELLAAHHCYGEWFSAPLEAVRAAAYQALLEATKVERRDHKLRTLSENAVRYIRDRGLDRDKDFRWVYRQMVKEADTGGSRVVPSLSGSLG